MTIEEDIEAFAQALPPAYDTEVELDALQALIAVHPDYQAWADHVVREVLADRLSKYRTEDRRAARVTRKHQVRARTLANIGKVAKGQPLTPASSLFHERYCVSSKRGHARHMSLGDMTAEDCQAAIEIYKQQRDAAGFKVDVLAFFARTLTGTNTVSQQFTEQQIERVYDTQGRSAAVRRRVQKSA